VIYLFSAGLGFFIKLEETLSVSLSLGILIGVVLILYLNVENVLKQFENERN